LVAKTGKKAVKTVGKVMDVRNGMVERKDGREREKVKGLIARDILRAETENEKISKEGK
jgi:hypothetical protein